MDTQETVYVLKKAPSRELPTDSQLRRRIAECVENCNAVSSGQEEFQINERVDKFLAARTILEQAEEDATTQISRDTIETVGAWVSKGANFSDLLPVSLLVQADQSIFKGLPQTNWALVSIHSHECPNLKFTLKLIVDRLTKREHLDDIQVDRRLTYDFGVLADWLEEHPHERIIVYMEDSEGFSSEIINGLVRYMSLYLDQVPFHLLSNLSTLPEIFEEKLTRESLLQIETHCFAGTPPPGAFLDDAAQRLAAIQCYLGPDLRQELAALRVDKAASALKYAVLAHYAGNPFAIVSEEAFEGLADVIRQLPSLGAEFKDLNNKDLARLALDSLERDALNEAKVNNVDLHRMVFGPTFRPGLELALSEPAHYGGQRETVPTAVLYQIFRESSVYINIYDMYCSFKAQVEPPQALENHDESQDWDKQALAWFLEGVAELKLMGVIRDCKRKFECVEKVSWMGV